MRDIVVILSGGIYIIVLLWSYFSLGTYSSIISKKARYSFFYATFASFVWFLSNSASLYFTDSHGLTLLSIQGTLFSTCFLTFFIFRYYNNLFAHNTYFSDKVERVLLGIASIVGITAFTNIYIKNVEISADGSVNPIFTPIFVIYFLTVMLLVTLSIFLIYKYSTQKLYSQQNRWKFLVLAIVITLIVVMLTNIILIFYLKEASSVIYGPFFFGFFLLFSIYIMNSLRVHDVRITINRFFRYSLLTIVYYFILLAVMAIAAYANINLFVAFIPITLITLTLGRLTYSFTNSNAKNEKKVRSYSSEISIILDTKEILNKLEVILQELLNPDFIHFIIVNNQKVLLEMPTYEGEKDVHFQKIFQLSNKIWNILNKNVVIIQSDLYSIMYIEKNKRLRKLYHLLYSAMTKSNTALVAPLNRHHDLYSVLLLGPKLDLSEITLNDIDLLENILQFTSVGISRALFYQETKDFASKLEAVVTQRTLQLQQANVKLESVVQELQTLNQAKSEFISIASHQLRTPISIIRGYVSMLLDGDFGPVPSEQRQMLDKTQQSVKQLINIVEDILNASRIEQGRLVIIPERVDIIEMLTTVTSELRQKASRKGLTITFEPKIPSLFVEVDKNKIFEVCMNLVDNALNYTLQGGVTVTVEEKEDKVLIAVKDTGIGIPKGSEGKIFQRFSRLDNARKVRPDGTGIGLYIAKTIIESHKGRVWFESEEGKGTTFFMELPKVYVPPPEITPPKN